MDPLHLQLQEKVYIIFIIRRYKYKPIVTYSCETSENLLYKDCNTKWRIVDLFARSDCTEK